MFNLFFKTIASKLNLILIVTVLSIMSISSFFTYKTYSNQVEQELKDEIIRIKKRLELILPSIIWNLQLNLLQDIIKTESLDKSIDAITVKDSDNNIIASITKKDIDIHKYSTQFSIVHSNEVIAFVTLYHNHFKIEQAKDQILQNLIVKAFIIIILLIIIFSFFVNKFILTNIAKLQKGISLFANDKDFSKTIFVNTNDELGFLAREFNNMKNELKDSFKKLENLNKELKDKVALEVEKNREKDKQLFESSKMAQMGEMIGNIAHQWRQPLSAISMLSSGYKTQKMLGIEYSNEELDKTFDKITERTEFLTQTIEDFRNFVKQDNDLSNLNIKDVINSTVNILQDTVIHLNISINLNLDDDCMVRGLKGELSQVVLNIINNARDILQEKDIDNKSIDVTLYKEKKNIIVKIQDNAGGIPDYVLPKIFDPYFTTKHQSQGTGIGLYMSKDIIEKHHYGKLIAGNDEDGAVFTIILPSID